MISSMIRYFTSFHSLNCVRCSDEVVCHSSDYWNVAVNSYTRSNSLTVIQCYYITSEVIHTV